MILTRAVRQLTERSLVTFVAIAMGEGATIKNYDSRLVLTYSTIIISTVIYDRKAQPRPQ